MLSEVDQEVLVALLLHGDDTPGNLADRIERTPDGVQKRLRELDDLGLVRSKGRGVWTLTYPGANMARTVFEHRETED